MDNPRVIDLLTQILQVQRQINGRLGDMYNGGLASINQRLERLEKEMETTNLKLQELTLFNLKLADELHNVMQLGDRVTRLEAAVFH